MIRFLWNFFNVTQLSLKNDLKPVHSSSETWGDALRISNKSEVHDSNKDYFC